MLNKLKRRKILKLLFGILFLPIEKLFSNLITQKDLIDAIEKAERRIKREKKEKEKQNKLTQASI